MFRTTSTIVAVLAAAAVAVPAATAAAGSPQVFSLGTALAEYSEPQQFSLGTALAEYAQKHGAVRAEPQVFSLGTALARYAQEHNAPQASATLSPTASRGFDWADAGIGGAVVGGVLLALLGTAGIVRRRPAGSLGRT